MRQLTPSDVHALLREHGLRPSRRLGQHFVADPNTARRIVRLAGVEAGDRVLEIGPGLGSLTLALVERGCSVLALELDRKLASVVEKVVAGERDVRIVTGDALTVDLGALLGEGPWHCVSNLPYNVATPVVIRRLGAPDGAARGGRAAGGGGGLLRLRGAVGSGGVFRAREDRR